MLVRTKVCLVIRNLWPLFLISKIDTSIICLAVLSHPLSQLPPLSLLRTGWAKYPISAPTSEWNIMTLAGGPLQEFGLPISFPSQLQNFSSPWQALSLQSSSGPGRLQRSHGLSRAKKKGLARRKQMGGSGNVTEGWGETIWQFHYTRPEIALLEIQRGRGSKQYRCVLLYWQRGNLQPTSIRADWESSS